MAYSRLADPAYERWLKVTRGLLKLKELIVPETDNVIKAFHATIVAGIVGLYVLPLCTCTHTNIDRRNKRMNPPCPRCDPPLGHIINARNIGAKRDINLRNSVPSKWATHMWEVAKCFMGKGLKADNQGTSDTDTSNLLILWTTCTKFDRMIANRNLLEAVLTVRNDTMHSPGMQCSQADMMARFGAIINLLNDTKLSPLLDPNAITSMEAIRDTPLVINADVEMTVWSDLINSHSDTLEELTSKSLNKPIAEFLNNNPDLLSRLKQKVGTLEREVSIIYRRTYEHGQRLESQQRVLGQVPRLQREVTEHHARLDSQQRELTVQRGVLGQVPQLQQKVDSLTCRVDETNQRMTLQQQERKAPDSHQVMTDLREELCETYLRTCHHVQPIPWVEKTLPLQDVFMEPALKQSAGNSFSQRQSEERKSWGSRQEELRACLGENCQQVLILLDGFDEATLSQKDLANILGELEMRGCTVIVTSRPGFCSSRFDVTFQLQGFDHQTRVRYINRFVEVVKGAADHPCTAILVHRLESPGIIGHLCQTPLFLVLVCLLGSQEGNTLPNTRTQLYEQFVSFLHRQAVERHGFQSDYMSNLQQTLQHIAFALLKDNTTDITLATIEQHSATQPSTPGPSTVKHDQPPTARADVTLRALCQVGFLIQNHKLQGLDEVTSGSFIHQSFVDYFAAKRFITMSDEQRESFIADHVSRKTMFHNVFVYVAGCCGREVFVELFDGWRRAVAALGAPRFDPSDPVSEMDRMYDLTERNHALLHDAPFSWLTESTDVCSASLALLTHGQPEAVCLADDYCTESCVRGVRTLVKALSGLQASPTTHPLHLALYRCEQLGAGDMLDVLEQVGLTHDAVDCVVLVAGVYGDPDWTVRECESLAALPACLRLKRIDLGVCEWKALDALSVSFTPTHALQRLTVWCDRPSGRGVPHSQHLTEFRRNVRCLSNIQRIELRGGEGEVSAEAERDLRDWGAWRGVAVVVWHY